MKRVLVFILAMAILVCAVPHMVFAMTTTNIWNMTYTLDESNKTAVLTNARVAKDVVVIPDKVIYNGFYYDVTAIGEKAFFGCRRLRSVGIPNSVKTIGKDAFFYCTSLRSVRIPNSVTSISNYAFFGCNSLMSVSVDPDNPNFSSEGDVILSKDSRKLVLCPVGKMGSYTIPNSVTTIGEGAFRSCCFLTSVTIGKNVNFIGERAFDLCDQLTSINVDPSNEKFKSKGGVIFNNDGTKLVLCPVGKKGNYTIPDGVITIGENAFRSCIGLTSVKISEGVTTIDRRAFAFCNLMSIDVPNSVTTIGDCAFEYCSRLASITIGNSVTTIGEGAFIGCRLKSIAIPDSVTTIGEGVFSDKLTSISVDSKNPNFKSEDGVLLNRAGTELILCPGSKTGSYTIPSGVDTIGKRAFSRCSGLTFITIPDSVTTIDDYAFWACSGLTSVMIPGSVSTIGEGAFNNCSKLASINVDPSNQRFKSEGGVLFDRTGTKLILCPGGKTGSYAIPHHVLTIGEDAFIGCGLTSVDIPDSVIFIEECAFFGCGLTSVKIPYSVITIGKGAFSSCSSLASVTIANGVTTIEDHAFLNCHLTSVVIPDSVTTIGENVFDDCCRLMSSVESCDSVTSIGNDSPPSECSSLISVKSYDSVIRVYDTSEQESPQQSPEPEETVDDFMSSNNIINPSLKQNQKGLTCWMFASMNIENYYRVRNHKRPIDGSEVDQACNFVAKKLNRTDILNNTQTAQEMIFYLNEKKISVKDYSFTVSDSSEKSDVIGAIESFLEDHFSNPDVQYHPPVAVNQNANHWITIIGMYGDDYLVCDSTRNNDEPSFVKKREILDSILGEVNAERHGATTDILVPNGIHSVYRGEVKNNHLSYLPKYGLYYDEKLGTIRFNARAFSSMFMKSYDIKVFSDNNGKFILDSNKSKRYLNDLGNYIEVVGGARTFKGNLEFTPFYTEKEKCGATILLPVAGSAKCKTEYGERSINYFMNNEGKFVIFDSELNPRVFDSLGGLQRYINGEEFRNRGWSEINDNVRESFSLISGLPLPPPPPPVSTKFVSDPRLTLPPRLLPPPPLPPLTPISFQGIPMLPPPPLPPLTPISFQGIPMLPPPPLPPVPPVPTDLLISQGAHNTAGDNNTFINSGGNPGSFVFKHD